MQEEKCSLHYFRAVGARADTRLKHNQKPHKRLWKWERETNGLTISLSSSFPTEQVYLCNIPLWALDSYVQGQRHGRQNTQMSSFPGKLLCFAPHPQHSENAGRRHRNLLQRELQRSGQGQPQPAAHHTEPRLCLLHLQHPGPAPGGAPGTDHEQGRHKNLHLVVFKEIWGHHATYRKAVLWSSSLICQDEENNLKIGLCKWDLSGVISLMPEWTLIVYVLFSITI